MDGIHIMNEEEYWGVGAGGTWGDNVVHESTQSSSKKIPIARDKLHINPFYRYLMCRGARKYPQTYNSHGVHTYHSKQLHHNLLFATLKKKIENVCEKWSYGHGTGYVYAMWINVTNKGGMILPHYHNPDGASYRITGVYYLSKPKKSGNLLIHNPDLQVVEAETDDIVLFGADMLHETEINPTNNERISCGFNFFQNRSD